MAVAGNRGLCVRADMQEGNECYSFNALLASFECFQFVLMSHLSTSQLAHTIR